ncbi:hypothetical protein HDF16_005213 [Granulicella aggregans]|uniref:Uncharacterized protein n=1 Tax=Granulicella aggregans TaxID=474949 RepID=A0A7W7ZIJ9_9BACT|nr:hypothetical protein [Granulicella aggregans]
MSTIQRRLESGPPSDRSVFWPDSPLREQLRGTFMGLISIVVLFVTSVADDREKATGAYGVA